MSKLLVVIGATGKQGGSVINAILSDATAKSTFKLRGVTRDVSKPASQALISKGVEMVCADLDDEATLGKAFIGAYAVFAVTDYWAKMDGEVEIRQGKAIADTAKAAGVEHYVWSNLVDTNKTTNGAFKVSHFITKATVGEYVKSIGLPWTFFQPGFYMSTIPNANIRKDDATGKYIFSLPVEPTAQIPLIDIESDAGKFVKAILMNREKSLNKVYNGAENYYTPQQVVDSFKAAFPVDGEGMTFQQLPDEVYVSGFVAFGMPRKVAEEVLENMHLMNKFGFYSGADLKESHVLLTEPLVNFTQYLKSLPAYKDLK